MILFANIMYFVFSFSSTNRSSCFFCFLLSIIIFLYYIDVKQILIWLDYGHQHVWSIGSFGNHLWTLSLLCIIIWQYNMYVFTAINTYLLTYTPSLLINLLSGRRVRQLQRLPRCSTPQRKCLKPKHSFVSFHLISLKHLTLSVSLPSLQSLLTFPFQTASITGC